MLLLAAAIGVSTLACAVLVCIHAFGRSVGTGFMVLLIPFYIFYYAFSQFEHPRKALIVPGLCGGVVLQAVLLVAAQV